MKLIFTVEVKPSSKFNQSDLPDLCEAVKIETTDWFKYGQGIEIDADVQCEVQDGQ
jgi:hypothetical protein